MAEIEELRTQPQDIQAEQSVLGAIFIDEGKLVFVREYIEPGDFFKYSHRLIFKAMIDLADRGDAIDATTVRNILDSQGDLQNIGGLSYLVEVINSVPTSANAEYYAKIVAEKAVLRRLISRLTESINQAYDGASPSDEIIAGAEKALIDVSENANRSGFKNIRDILNINFGSLEARSLQTSDITGIATGYRDLDHMTTGLHEEELIILAARTGQLTDEEWRKYAIAQGNLANASIYIDDTPGIRITEIRSRARKLAQETGNLGLILIDYLQLITGTGRENRQQEVSEISRQLKILAKELKVPVIALSQLSRGVEQRQDKRPVLSDIRESGSIEQDADIVAFLYRDDYYDRAGEEDEDGMPNNTVEVIIEKNRSGARGTVELIFQKEYNKFSSISKREDQ